MTSNIVKFPQKSEEEKQTEKLVRQADDINEQSDLIEQQRIRIEALEKPKNYKQLQRELTELNADGDD
mgnify:FL=1|jgi:hypothetical protein|tara:strand:- start:246 stop:449 length:204 start_codon:yes stop_codon:yes gene_type:complete